MSKGIWDSLNEKANNETIKQSNLETIKQVNKETIEEYNNATSEEEKKKRTYNLPVSTITKLYELKAKFPLEDIESIVNKAIVGYHEKHVKS